MEPIELQRAFNRIGCIGLIAFASLLVTVGVIAGDFNGDFIPGPIRRGLYDLGTNPLVGLVLIGIIVWLVRRKGGAS